jgi:hypothetical protein
MLASPRTLQLLQRLCEFEPGDMDMPLELLLNVHRSHLRHPLEAMVLLAPGPLAAGDDDETAEVAAQVVSACWPDLRDGDIYNEQGGIHELELKHRRLSLSLQGVKRQQEIVGKKPAVSMLVDATRLDWEAHEPLVLLHQLSWGTDFMLSALPLLEAELGAHWAVAEMILTLGSR